MSKKCAKFPNRIVLTIGYPWFNGSPGYNQVLMRDKKIGGAFKNLKFPGILWNNRLPKYRLVLEKI